MKATLHATHANTDYGLEAEAILRSCVHCGFCNATCPTYLTQGDERDGPRGRIYLIKQLLETDTVSERSVLHLDRCLTCRNCETTCPSSVQYSRLADIGRHIAEGKVRRSLRQRVVRVMLRKVLPHRTRFGMLLRVGQFLRPVLPAGLKKLVPLRVKSGVVSPSRASRKMLLLAGCVQPGATPGTNAAACRVLDRLGIALTEVAGAGCCGAISHHLSVRDEALAFMRRNIDAWWPHIEAGAEAIVVTASGCAMMIREYGHLLKNDPAYADKAARVSALAKDLSEIVVAEDIEQLELGEDGTRTAVHCPCSMQHGLGLAANVTTILERAGITLTPTRDAHLCCGSAGTYSLLQPALSRKLLTDKLEALSIGNPERIVSANVGCQLYLSSQASVPVQHWIELLDR